MAFTISTKFSAIDRVSSTVSKISRKISRFSTKAASSFKAVGNSIDNFNKKLTNSVKGIGLVGTALGALSVASFFQTAAEASLDLDRNIGAAAAKFGIFSRSSKDFKKLEDTARKLGGTTEFTAGQAAEGLKNLATAGFKADAAIASIGTTLDLATATQSELGIAADVAGKSLAAFGLKASDPKKLQSNLQRVSDTLNKIITTTGFGSLEELQTTLGASGASANAAGLQIEQWGAIVGTAVSGAIDASSAGSQLNMALIRLAKPTKNASALIKKLGIDVKDGKGNFKDIFSILGQLEKGLKGMGSQTKTAALSTLFGAESSRLFNVLLDKGIGNVKALSKEYEGATGTTKKMANLMRGGLSGALASAESAIAEVGISLQKTFDKEIATSIKNITEGARSIGIWVKENKQLLKTALNITVALAKMFFVFKAIVITMSIAKAVTVGYYTALGILAVFSSKAAIAAGTNIVALKAYMVATKVAAATTKVFTGVQAAFNVVMSLNPIGLVIVAIGALIIGITLLIVKWKSVKAWIDKVSKSAVFQILSMANPILKIIELIAFMQDRWAGIKNAFKSEGIVGGMKAIGKALLSFMIKPFEVILGTVAKITNFQWAKDATKGLSNFRASLDKGLVIEPKVKQPKVPAPELLPPMPFMEQESKSKPIVFQDAAASPPQNLVKPVFSGNDKPQNEIMNMPKIEAPQLDISVPTQRGRSEIPNITNNVPDVSVNPIFPTEHFTGHTSTLGTSVVNQPSPVVNMASPPTQSIINNNRETNTENIVPVALSSDMGLQPNIARQNKVSTNQIPAPIVNNIINLEPNINTPNTKKVSPNMSKVVFNSPLVLKNPQVENSSVESTVNEAQRQIEQPLLPSNVVTETIRTQRSEKVERNTLDININDQTGNAEVKQTRGVKIPITVKETAGGF